MKFHVDKKLCVGCPEVFELVDGKSQVKLDTVPEKLQANALEAEEVCPVGAISHN